jgi:hypothetical protein
MGEGEEGKKEGGRRADCGQIDDDIMGILKVIKQSVHLAPPTTLSAF